MVTSEQCYRTMEDVQHNCNISDARDHGIYSMCTMVLKLRNLYKWEHSLEPWQEPETTVLLDWIEAKENYWRTITEEPYRHLGVNGLSYLPDDAAAINVNLVDSQLLYGAGYGRSMKTVYFLAEILEKQNVAGFPVYILGTERAKEMASPFAMAQDGTIIIRKDNLRFFLWDYIQELRSSCRTSFRHALKLHGVLKDGQLDQLELASRLDSIVEDELDLFIYHEVGELLETTFDSRALQMIVSRFPGSVYELVCRSVKDILADTHPEGLLAHLIREKKETSLSFYVGFLDGLRKKLFPEIIEALQRFLDDRNWQGVEQARARCRTNSLDYAKKLQAISKLIGHASDDHVRSLFNRQILLPLGLEVPQ